MSHNVLTVDNQKPTNAGEIPVNLSSFATISNVQSNQVIKYDGSNWQNGANPSTSPIALKAGWRGFHYSFSNGTYYYRTNHYFMHRKATANSSFYLANASFRSATGTNTPLSSGDTNTTWFESIRVNEAGTYLCMMNPNCNAGTYVKFRWHDGNGNPKGNEVTVYNANNFYGAICTAIITTTTANQNIRLVCTGYSGNCQITEPRENAVSSVTILKLD